MFTPSIMAPLRFLLLVVFSLAPIIRAQLPGIDFDTLAFQGADPVSAVYKTTTEGDLTADVYMPPKDLIGDHLLPALIFVHGGGWKAGTRANHHEHSRYFAARGMVVFNLTYRLIPGSGGDIDLFTQVGDIRSAVRWVRAHAASYGIDPERIALVGESAGGHLAACVALIDAFDDPSENPAVSAQPNLAILLNPITDLPRIPWFSDDAARIGELPLPIDDTPIADPLDETIHPARRLSPLFYAAHANQPPTLFIHGAADSVVPFSQPESMHHALLSAGHESQLISLPRTDHAFMIPGYGPPDAINTSLRAMDGFLADHGYLEGPASLLGLDINRLPNGDFDLNLDGWTGTGGIQVASEGATSQSTGFLRSTDAELINLVQIIPLDAFELPPHAVATQLFTFRFSGWIRVSEIFPYDRLEISLRCESEDGTLLSNESLTWDTASVGTWVESSLSGLIPEGTNRFQIGIATRDPIAIEVDELSLTLSSTTRTHRFAEWQEVYFSPQEIEDESVSAANVILPDGSGLRNFAKFALGLARTVKGLTFAPSSHQNNHLALRFPYHLQKSDVDYRVGFGSDLSLETWTYFSSLEQAPIEVDAYGIATVVDPESATLRFGQLFIEPISPEVVP